ncbi:hypothetical protein OBK13_06275 [Empedobacter falsenii]
MMDFKIIILLLFLISCTNNENINYPSEINEIKEVVLERTDKNYKGKFAEIKELNGNEIELLLDVLNKSKEVDSKGFTEDFQIVFSTKSGTKRIMVDENKIKGFNSNKVFQINEVSFLTKF